MCQGVPELCYLVVLELCCQGGLGVCYLEVLVFLLYAALGQVLIHQVHLDHLVHPLVFLPIPAHPHHPYLLLFVLKYLW